MHSLLSQPAENFKKYVGGCDGDDASSSGGSSGVVMLIVLVVVAGVEW